MFPGTIVNWIDQSATPEIDEITVDNNAPLFFVVSSFDKGSEKLMEISGSDFYKMFGTPLFSKHGQNGIQAARLIDAGARLLVKRICAADALLANTVIVANVTKNVNQKKNDQGQPLYYDTDGNETTTVTDNPVMVTSGTIKYEAKTVQNVKTFKEVVNYAVDPTHTDFNGEHKFPIMVFTDNGRGLSDKSFRFVPDYYSASSLGTMMYSLNIYEGTALQENQLCSVDPDVTFDGTSYGLDLGITAQIDAKTIEAQYASFVAEVAEILGVNAEDARKNDLLYCYDINGVPFDNLTLTDDSVDLNALYGIELTSGSNGAFGDTPADPNSGAAYIAWASAIANVFLGTDSTEVWDVDEHKIACVLDAAFPNTVKEAIAYFVTNRKDCVYFRDYGLGLTTLSQIIDAYNTITAPNRSRYIADYCTTYTIKDPNNGKNIEVTMLYDMASILPNYFMNSPAAPCAGIYNNFILQSAIKGTVNFTPVITPQVNQKETFDNMRINYAIFQGDLCVVQSCYSSQVEKTEYSWINNVVNVQDVIRAIRTACPKNRYRLVSGTDLSDYADAVRVVLNRYQSRFNTLEFTYLEDKIQSVNKIFYAVIKVSFGQWAQTEIFDVYALNAAEV